MTGPALSAPAYAGSEYLKALRGKFFEQRIPAAGSIDLTHRCNLSCVHCYLATAPGRSGRPARKELSTEQWIAVLDQAVSAGCLDLLITGGEPLLRRDFEAIYRKAKTSGMLVTVFTNGTLITERILDLFADLPPQQVEVSLYGATAETCDSVTGVAGSFERTLAGIHALVDRGVPTGLKTMALTINRHEMKAIEAVAGEMGVPFRLDAALFACGDGNRGPLRWRLEPAEAAGVEFEVEGLAEKWVSHYESMKGTPAAEGLIVCGAAATAFHVDPTGMLRPCQMLDDPSHDLLEGSFREGWEGAIARLRDIRPRDDFRCSGCGKQPLCGICPAIFKLETGEMDVPSPFLCKLAEERQRCIIEHSAASTKDYEYNA